MNERLKKLAEQAGIGKDFAISGLWLAEEEELERFAELIRQDERDKCAQDYLQDCCDAVDAARLEEREANAKLCDEEGNQSCIDNEAGGMYWCADAIRARG